MTDRRAPQHNRDAAASAERRPLSGVKVLDLADEAVVLAPRLLADLGADVIRVESAEGDRIRRRGPFVDGIPGPERSLAHLLYNAGKKSLAIDLGREEARDLVDRLAGAVDVAVLPLEKPVGVGDLFNQGRLHGAHPSTGVVDVVLRRGSNHAAVTDLIGVAAGGLLYLNGFPDDPPNVPAGKLAYKQASLAVAVAAMSLAMTRRRSGRGGVITVCMQEAVMWTTLQTANENYWHWHRTRPARSGLGAIGGRSVYRARDGLWVSFSIPPPYWGAYASWIAEVTGYDAFLTDTWQDPRYQFENVGRTTAMTEALCASLARDRLVEEGQRRHLLVLPVNTVADVARDPHLRARGFFAEVPHPALGRSLTMPAPPFLANGARPLMRPAPRLGEHSIETLRDRAGIDDATLDCLVATGVVGKSEAASVSRGNHD